MQPIEFLDPIKFWAHVPERGDGCWTWGGKINRDGYGEFAQQVAYQRGCWRAHRVAYELVVGLIPDGLVLDHLCRNRACCNPAHLEPVTNGENIRRGMVGRSARALGRDGVLRCRNQHDLDAVGVNLRSNGYTECRACAADRRRRHDATRPPRKR